MSRVAFVVLLDIFVLLFFTVAYFMVSARPDIEIGMGNMQDDWEGVFLARGAGSDEEIFIDGRWDYVRLEIADKVNRSLRLDGCSEMCWEPRYKLASLEGVRIHVGGELGFRLAKVVAGCGGTWSCARLKIRLEDNKVMCGDRECM